MIYIDYTVTFKDAEGGVLSEEIYHYGNKVSEPATPVKNADKTYTYTFKGWDKKVVDCIANVEYRAQFDSVYIDYTICFVANNNEIALYTLHYGDAIVIPEAPNRDGYAFKGWSPNVEYTATGNKTYTAQYDKLYTVKVEGGTVNNASSAVISNGSSVTIRANVAVNNAPFKGWSIDGDKTIISSDREYTFSVNDDVVITAVYETMQKEGLSSGAIVGISVGATAVGFGGIGTLV